MPDTGNKEDSPTHHFNEVQQIIDEMRGKLKNNPFNELQTYVNNMRNMIMNDQNFFPKHKERLLERVEDVQNLLDGNFLYVLEDVQRELHKDYKDHSGKSILERMIESLKEFL